jgi:hypothetical protein
LEVKGLSGANLVIELTPNEYHMMQKQRDSYRICVVVNALVNKAILYVFAYSAESNAWEDDKGRKLTITEIVSARMISQ